MARADKALSIGFSGEKELNKKLGRLELKTQRSVVTKAYRKGIKIIRDRARFLAPEKSGRLKKGIRHKVSSGYKGVTAKVETRDRAFFGIPADSKWYYPAIIEYGAPSRNIPQQSYLRRGMDETRGQAMRIIKMETATGIVRLAKR